MSSVRLLDLPDEIGHRPPFRSHVPNIIGVGRGSLSGADFGPFVSRGHYSIAEPRSVQKMIRRYVDRDLSELLDVWYRASLISHPFLSGEFLETERRQIAERWLPIAETIVYEIDGHVVGFLALIDIEVGAIFVDPDYQGQGIGRALMDTAQRSRSFLELNVFEDNSIGRRFYDSYGFEFVDRHVHEPTGHTELRLRLGHRATTDD